MIEVVAVHYMKNQYGCGPITDVGDLIEVRLQDEEFGQAISNFTISCCHYEKSGSGYIDPWDVGRAQRIIQLPRRRFERKRARLMIKYPSRRFAPDELRGVYTRDITPDIFDRSFDDLIDATEYGLCALRKSDDFDAAAYLARLRDIRVEPRPTGDAFTAFLMETGDQARQVMAARDPWSMVDVDWSRMHPDARRILDDPRDWSPVDDFSPHGNDTGADMYQAWRSYRTLSPADALSRLFGDGFRIENPEPSSEFWGLWVQAHLALAFGHVKRAGTCPEPLRGDTLKVLMQEYARAQERVDWDHRQDWLTRIERYAKILAGL